jgi:hypothetical protein
MIDIILFFFSIVNQVQNTLISLTLTHLYRFVNEYNKNLILRITIQEFSSEKSQDILTSKGKYFFLENSSIKFFFVFSN